MLKPVNISSGFYFSSPHFLQVLTSALLEKANCVVLFCIGETTNKASKTFEAVPSNVCQKFSSFIVVVLKNRYSFHLSFRDAAGRNEPLFQLIKFDHVNQIVEVYVDNLHFIVRQRSQIVLNLVEI